MRMNNGVSLRSLGRCGRCEVRLSLASLGLGCDFRVRCKLIICSDCFPLGSGSIITAIITIIPEGVGALKASHLGFDVAGWSPRCVIIDETTRARSLALGSTRLDIGIVLGLNILIEIRARKGIRVIGD
jgi:hypothetical protein